MAKVEFRKIGYSNPTYYITHDCDALGHWVEISEDWGYCPWCGRGLVRAIKEAKIEKERKNVDLGQESYSG